MPQYWRPLASAATTIFAALICFSTEQGAQRKADPKGDQAIRVEVEMVSLPVVVTTRDGKRVTDLTREDFTVLEDGVQQTVSGFAATDEPVSIALMLDTSGSTEMRLAQIQNEAIKFVNLLHPDDSVAIISFAKDVSLLEDFSIDRDKNAYGIKETRPGGWTCLYEAVWLALEEVLKPIKERCALVLFTDGVDTASHKVSQKETLELSRETRATIYSVYFNTEDDLYRSSGSRPTIGGLPLPGGGPPIVTTPPVAGPYPPAGGGRPGDYSEGRRYLNQLAENSGGLVFDALRMTDLGPAFEKIARELASQYSIGYYSSNPKHDGKFRKVEVKVSRPGLVARTKKGYFTKKDSKS